MRVAKGLEVRLILAGAQAQDQAAVAQAVERAGRLHHELRSAPGKRHDRGDEPQPRRGHGYPGQGHEQVRGGAAHGDAKAVPDGEAVPAGVLGGASQPHDSARVRENPERADVDGVAQGGHLGRVPPPQGAMSPGGPAGERCRTALPARGRDAIVPRNVRRVVAAGVRWPPRAARSPGGSPFHAQATASFRCGPARGGPAGRRPRGRSPPAHARGRSRRVAGDPGRCRIAWAGSGRTRGPAGRAERRAERRAWARTHPGADRSADGSTLGASTARDDAATGDASRTQPREADGDAHSGRAVRGERARGSIDVRPWGRLIGPAEAPIRIRRNGRACPCGRAARRDVGVRDPTGPSPIGPSPRRMFRPRRLTRRRPRPSQRPRRRTHRLRRRMHRLRRRMHRPWCRRSRRPRAPSPSRAHRPLLSWPWGRGRVRSCRSSPPAPSPSTRARRAWQSRAAASPSPSRS